MVERRTPDAGKKVRPTVPRCAGTESPGLATLRRSPEARCLKPEANYLEPETIYHNPETIYHNPETIYHNPEMIYLDPEA